MTEAVEAALRHRMPGRVRFALGHPLPARESLESLADALASVEGIREVEIRPRSGSIIVRHGGSYDDIAKALADAGLVIEVNEEESRPVDPVQETLDRLSVADRALQRWTGGRADIWSVSFSALVAGGLIQLGRGRVAGPALTLFGQAATLAMARPLRRFLG